MQDMIHALQQYGWTEKEAKVYLTALELGSAPASTIARHAGEHRITTYSILKDFEREHIAQHVLKHKVQYFSVITPDKLASQMKQKYILLEQKVPELMALTNVYDNKPKITYLEGFTGLKKIFLEVLAYSEFMQEDEYYYSFLGTTGLDPQFSKFLEEEFILSRKKHQSKTKVIISAKNKTSYAALNKKLHDAVIIDNDSFDLGNEIVLYGKNKVAILMYQTGEMAGMIIESKSLYNGLKSIFYLIWETQSTGKIS